MTRITEPPTSATVEPTVFLKVMPPGNIKENCHGHRYPGD